MSEVCGTCGHAWFLPSVYWDADQEHAAVPVAQAASEAEAREHLLIELTDWSWHEDQREEVAADWRYRGRRQWRICEHAIEEPCPHRGCRRSAEVHMFELAS